MKKLAILFAASLICGSATAQDSLNVSLVASTLDNAGNVTGVAYQDHYAYLVDDDLGLTIFSVEDPSSPVHLGTCSTANEAASVVVSGEHAYIIDYDYGLRIIDVSDPSSPVEVGVLQIQRVADLSYSDGYIYLAGGDWYAGEDLLVIDVSDPSDPTVTSAFHIPYLSSSGVHVIGIYAYVVAYDYFDACLEVIDISDPYQPEQVGILYNPTERTVDLWVDGNYAYVASGYHGLVIIDVSDPGSPSLAGSLDVEDYSRDVMVSRNYAYLVSRFSGLRVIDVNDPTAPFETGYYQGTGSAYGVAVGGGYAGVADYYQFSIFDCTEATPPSLIDVILIPPQQLVIPRGGSFQYDALLMSNLPTPALIDIWTYVNLPNGNLYGPMLRINNFPFTPNTIIEVDAVTQSVPFSAPLGMYTYHLNAGQFPGLTLEGDHFSFEVVAALNAEGAQQSTWSTWGYEQAFGMNTGIRQNELVLPDEFDLHEAWPNPFNPSTNLTVELPEQAYLNVIVYNVNDRQVAELANGSFPAGSHTLTFDASDLASGLYFIRAIVPSQLNQVQKVMLVR